jgi:hypothetical protein
MKAENSNPASPISGIVNTEKLALLGHSLGIVFYHKFSGVECLGCCAATEEMEILVRCVINTPHC